MIKRKYVVATSCVHGDEIEAETPLGAASTWYDKQFTSPELPLTLFIYEKGNEEAEFFVRLSRPVQITFTDIAPNVLSESKIN